MSRLHMEAEMGWAETVSMLHYLGNTQRWSEGVQAHMAPDTPAGVRCGWGWWSPAWTPDGGRLCSALSLVPYRLPNSPSPRLLFLDLRPQGCLLPAC